MNFDPNALFYAMQIYFQKKFLDVLVSKRERLYFLNEGSSRSSKTFDAFHFLYWLCGLPEYQKNGLSIYVYRSTLKDCREITYQEDFVQCMKLIGVYDESYARNAGVSPEYRLFSSVIKFRGLDGSSEAGRKDVVFFNEALDNEDEGLVLDLTLRSTTCAIFDWNPKLTDHFLFKWEGRKNHLFTRTTFLDNKHLDNVVKSDIMATCPWDFSDFDFERREWMCSEADRKPNIENTKYNTVNRWRWLVYGEGLRCPQDGAVFPDITWIDAFPDDCEEVNYGLDFGYRCLDEKTLITTDRGLVQINQLTTDDKVLTRFGYRNILRIFDNGFKEVVTKRIKTANFDGEITSTEEHHFNINKKWKKYGELQEQDKLYVLSNLTESNLRDIHTGSILTTIFGKAVDVQELKDFIKKFGKVLMEKFKKAWLYIILIVTLLIMIFPISCSYLIENTPLFIKRFQYLIKQKMGLRIESLFNIQKIIGFKEGIKSLLIYKRKLGYVSCVHPNTPLQIHINNFALLIVKNFTKGTLPPKMKRGFALCVARLMNAINICKNRLVQLNVGMIYQSVTGLKEIERKIAHVYDIEVEGVHEYFANGILVHNCDPTAFVRVGRKGLNIYIESLFYQPCENPDELYEHLLPFLLKEVETRKKMAKGLDYPSIHVTCDSASTFIATGVDFIDVLDNTRYLRGHEFQFDAVFKKFPIVTGISAMNRFKLHIVRDANAKKEFENYTRIKQNGHFIEKFSERNNHIIDAVRYVVMEWYASYVQV